MTPHQLSLACESDGTHGPHTSSLHSIKLSPLAFFDCVHSELGNLILIFTFVRLQQAQVHCHLISLFNFFVFITVVVVCECVLWRRVVMP